MSRVLYSLPGDWIDRTGYPKRRPQIKRILAVKADHIGDLLIAGQALMLLRQFFSDACIDLVCGPWNAGLARRLGLFDHVFAVNIFHEISDRQGDREQAHAAKRKGAALLQELALGPYDLAIDLRYDSDTRPVLPAIDARVYAGFGSRGEFPFLDVALPIHQQAGAATGDSAITLSPRQFQPVMGAGIAEAAGSAGRFSASTAMLEIGLSVEGARSPDECGTVPGDLRALGIALEAIELVPADEADDAQPRPIILGGGEILFLSGWASPERWGTWALGAHARLAVRIPPAIATNRFTVVLSLRGHVNVANPEVSCTVEAEGAAEPALLRLQYPTTSGRVGITLARPAGVARLSSPPFRTPPGAYSGVARLFVPREIEPSMSVVVGISAADTGIAIWRGEFGAHHLRHGLCDLPLRFNAELSDSALVATVTVSDPGKFDGTSIEFFALRCDRALQPRLPAAHMEDWASLLVLRVAQLFSSEPPFDAPGVLQALRADRSAEVTSGMTQMIVSRLRGWRHAGGCVVAFAIGCNSAIRTWPFTHWVELGRALLRVRRVKLVLVGGSGDQDAAARACAMLGLPADKHSLCGVVPLDELGAVLEACDLFVGNNTGTTHFAGRVGVRTIGIYSGTNHPREWAPVGPNTSWIMRDEPCAPCSLVDLRDCKYGHVCLRDLMPADVLDVVLPEVQAVLDRRPAAEPEHAVGPGRGQPAIPA
jgi:ADP-heptose:LPS heptosyltransferase